MLDDEVEAPRRRLSEREGRAEPRGPFEGVPAHLKDQLAEWLEVVIGGPYPHLGPLAKDLALFLHIEKGHWGWMDGVVSACKQHDDRFLDALDRALSMVHGEGSDELQRILTVGLSVWEVNERRDGLRRRVPRVEQAAYDQAASKDDEMAKELETAWGKVYGRQPDPSGAWVHAIKAVEWALGDIVTPNDKVTTLGKIIPALRDGAKKFSFRLMSSGKTGSVEALSQMLQLMYPNPDRHGAGDGRVPSMEEAANVVQLAVLVVGWVRSEALSRRSK